MSAELHVAQGRPNVSGDLPSVLGAGPMFRRAVVGYDRFQVDTYVQWAEDELAGAGREREHLLDRHVRTQAALEEARQLLAHSAGGAEFLMASRRIGAMLAAAADEAAAMRHDAAADRSAAAAESEQLVAAAERGLVEAVVDAERIVTEASAQAEALVAEGEQASREAHVEAEARLAKVRAIEQRAAEQAEQTRRRAVADALAAQAQARSEVVQLLTVGREQRRRADAEAEATRERLDREALSRRASLLDELTELEHRRAVLRAEVELLAATTRTAGSGRLDAHVRRLLERFRSRPRSLRAP